MVHGRRTWVVLGREQYSPGWRGSHKWSEFGGQCAEGETVEATAAREFFEETLGVFGDVRDALATRQYAFRLSVRRSTARHGLVTKHLYVLQMPWDATVAQRFHGRREHLKHILFAVSRIRHVQRRLAAGRHPVPDYLCRTGGRMLLVTDIDAIEQIGDGSYRLMARACVASADRYFGTFDHGPEPVEVIVPADAADEYARIIALKSWLDRLIASFPADVGARAISYKDHGPARAWLPYVRREFLEKDLLRGWRLPDLALAARVRDDRFRISFVTPLAIALRQLARVGAEARWPLPERVEPDDDPDEGWIRVGRRPRTRRHSKCASV